MWAAGRRAWPAAAAACGLVGAGSSSRRGTRCDAPPAAFSKSEFTSFPITEVRKATVDTNVIRCQLPSSGHRMGMTVSSLVMVQGAVGEDGKAPARPYTPITTDDQLGYFELMVKGYPTGTVSKYLCSLKPGDTVQVKGPFPKLPYKANMKKQIGMVAGGSGITPMVQVLKEIVNNPDDKTCVTLIYGNQKPSNIPLRAELEDMASKSNGRLKVLYVVDKNDTADPNIFHVGYVTAEAVAGVLPRPSEDTLVYVCGPPGMLKAVAGDKKFEKGKPPAQGEVGGILKELGYSSDMVFKF